MDIQTHVSTLDVSRFQKWNNHSSNASTLTSPSIGLNPSPNSLPKPNSDLNSNTNPTLSHNSNFKPVPIHKGSGHPDSQTFVEGGQCVPEEGAGTGPVLTEPYSETSQVAVIHGGEKEVELMENDKEREVEEEWEEEEGFAASPLAGEYDEEESARFFQEALREWRRGRRSKAGGEGDTVWTPAEARPVSVSAMATQADLSPDGGTEGRGEREGGGRIAVRVEFSENSLTYLDRLLLKKHRRTPIETYRPLSAARSLASLHTEEETANSLTAEEEDFRRYCVSLFAVPASRGGTEPQITTPGSCLIIEVLDEAATDLNGVFVGEQKTNNNRKVPSPQQFSNKRSAVGLQPDIASAGSTRLSPPTPLAPSKLQRAPVELKGTKKLHSSKTQSPLLDSAMKSLSSETQIPTCSTTETPWMSKTSVKTPTSKSYFPSAQKSKPDNGLLQLSCSTPLLSSQPKTTESSHVFPLSSPDDSPLFHSIRRSPNKEECSSSPSKSLSLRSTFTLSPSGSTELLPKVDQSVPSPNRSKSPQFPKQSQSSPLVSEPASSPKSPLLDPFGLASPKQSQQSLNPASAILPNHYESPLSPMFPRAPHCGSFIFPLSSPQLSSHSPTPPAKSRDAASRLSQSNSVSCRSPLTAISCSSLSNPSSPDVYSRYISTQSHVSSSSPLTGDHKSTLSHQDTRGFQSDSPHLIMARQSPVAVKMEDELSLPTTDTGDEMSSDSLGLNVPVEDSSDEEVKMNGSLGWRASEEEQRNTSSPHPEDSFVPVNAECEEDLQIDTPGQLSDSSMVYALAQKAGSGSEQFCGTDGFLTSGLACSSGLIGTAEYKHSDLTHMWQNCQDDSDTLSAGSISWMPSSNVRAYAEEHLVITVMKNNDIQPTRLQTHSTTPIGRQKKSAYELGTSGSRSSISSRTTPTLSRPARTSPRPPSPSRSHSPSFPLSPSLSACLSRPTSGSSSVELGTVFRPLSRAAQEIMEICGLDQTGCEDPDLHTDTNTYTLSCLERELQLMGNDTGMQAFIAGGRVSESPGHHRNQAFTRNEISEEQQEEEEETQRDRQSVLSLP